MKLSDRLVALVEEKLADESTVAHIKEKILTPSLAILKEHIATSGTNDQLIAMTHQMLWPVLALVIVCILLCAITVILQIYLCVTR